MRIFHERVWDGLVTNSGVPTSHMFNQLLASADRLAISGYTAQVQQSSASNLEILLQGSGDGYLWHNHAIATVGNVSFTGETLFQALANTTKYPLVRFFMYFNNVDNVGIVRFWVTGRDFSRRAASRSQQAPAQPGQPAAPPSTMTMTR